MKFLFFAHYNANNEHFQGGNMMKTAHLTFALGLSLAMSSYSYAAQIQPTAAVKQETSIIKNVAATLKDGQPATTKSGQTALDQLIKEHKTQQTASAEERRALARLNSQPYKMTSQNKFATFIQNLFGG